ncbi:hypothetical protein ACFV4N_18995 [Actinosynnema sp. NPDC059797]
MLRSVRLVVALLLALGTVVGGGATAVASAEPETITIPLNPTVPGSGTAVSSRRTFECEYTYTPSGGGSATITCVQTGGPSGFYLMGAVCRDGSSVTGKPLSFGRAGSVSCPPGSGGIRELRLTALW